MSGGGATLKGRGEKNTAPPPLEGGGRGEGSVHTLTRHARAMRHQPTPAEHMLWRSLRARQTGAKWRRQVPIGPFIVDFFCPAACLIVEVDGATHAGGEPDAQRDAWLRGKGYAVLRVWNNEVTGNLDGVLRVVIDAVAAATPPPNPLPQGEGARLPRRRAPAP